MRCCQFARITARACAGGRCRVYGARYTDASAAALGVGIRLTATKSLRPRVGMLLSEDVELIARARKLGNPGIANLRATMSNNQAGFNHRMSNKSWRV